MKLSTVIFAAATAAAVYAEDTPATVAPQTDAPTATTTAPSTSSPTTSTTTKTPSTASPATPGATSAGNTQAGKSPLDDMKQQPSGYSYQMPYVRVVQARVQKDKPELIKGRFVSKFGNGDLEKGYMSALDTVNTASVEGALMFVQAEGINVNSRAEKDRCERKNGMNYVVFYEILIAQSNETIAQFSDTWNVPEYGRMMPMDSGRCTPLKGDEFPPECLQYNGDKGQPNLGPNVGGGLKNNDVRAPYPDNYWFSFPNTCPLKVWGEKEDVNNECRAKTRKGLCDLGVAPDGITCTFAYDIIGWVPIDDVVGITAIPKPSGGTYENFTTWCQADSKNIEFAGNDKTGEMTSGLDFWKDPTDPKKNSARAAVVVDLYQKITKGTFVSTQIPASDAAHFKDLPDPENLSAMNPPCYKTVPSCNSGAGCQRLGFSQICFPCQAAGGKCKTDSSFKFPKLAKAPSSLSEAEQTSGSRISGATGANGNINGTNTGSASSLYRAAFATLSVAAATVLAL